MIALCSAPEIALPRIKTLTNKLAIWVFANDHAPPHFHIISPDTDVLVDMRTLAPIIGDYTRQQLAAGIAWASVPENMASLEAEWSKLNEQD
jgi:hypothetical protein